MRTILRAFMLGLSLLSFQEAVFSQQVAKTIPNSTSPDGLIGFLEFRPSDYGSQKHPLIIFLHGIGERGNGTSQIGSVTANGIPNYCANGASMRFTAGGQTSSFVVLSPQLSAWYGYWPTFYVREMIKYAKANLQIDPDRIYITGLSLGGGGTWRAITDASGFDYTFDAGIAAAAPVCGTQEETDADFCKTIGDNHLPVWAFHSMDDGSVGVGATQHAEVLASFCGNLSPAIKFTYYQSGGHFGAWLNAYDTGHITRATVVNGNVVNFTAVPNLYEWFLSNKRNTGSSTPTYTAPVVNAGSAQIITLPLNTITLTGSGTGTNGATISSYSWTKTSGPSAGVISLPLLNTTLVTGLVQGTYVFTLTVTDNHGLTSSSNVTITVNPLLAIANKPPVPNAGNNVTITLPTNSTTLNGTGSYDPDGSIQSYTWYRLSGPTSYNIANSNSSSTLLNNLVQGVYVFALQVTDNAGATTAATVTITVNAAQAVNQPPVPYAGNNVTVTLPTNYTTLNGTGSYDPDGSIKNYTWYRLSGPTSYNIASPNSSSTLLNNLVQGVYVFALQVTDNAGATTAATVTITVNAAQAVNQSPVPYAGSNVSITLPTNYTTLNGTGSYDPDGSIQSYTWYRLSGPSTFNISNPNAASTLLNNLVQGVYMFALQVTDNVGATTAATVTVTVNPAVSTPAGLPPATEQPIGYIKMSVSAFNACNDASPDGRTPVYGSSIANGALLYLDAAHTKPYNGGWNWFSFTATPGSTIAQSFAIFPNGSINLMYDCSTLTPINTAPVTTPTTPTAPATPPPASGNFLGYIKMSVSAFNACNDASTDGRIPVYGSSINNGAVLYTDVALTQPVNGGFNWYSFTTALGAASTQTFAVYPEGAIFYSKSCSSNLFRTAETASSSGGLTAEQQDAMLRHLRDSAAAAAITVLPFNQIKLNLYPNPVHTTATVELNSEDNSVKIVSLYSASGVLKAKYTWTATKGRNIFSLKNVAGLTNGLYIIEVKDSNGKSGGSFKFIKM